MTNFKSLSYLLVCALFFFASCSEDEVELGTSSNTIALSSGPAVVTEGNEVEFTLAFQGPVPTSPISVDYSFANGNETVTGNVSFPAGESIATFAFTVPDDNILEADTTMAVLSLTSAGAMGVDEGNSELEILVLEDSKVIGFMADMGDAAESPLSANDTISIPIAISNALDGQVSISYTLSGSATEGVDYELISDNPLVVETDAADAFVRFVVLDDLSLETSEELTVTINNLSIADASDEETSLDTDNADVTFTIADDLKTFSFADAGPEALVISEAGSVVLEVLVDNPLAVSTTVNFDQTNLPAGLALNQGSVTFLEGETSRRITLEVAASAFTGTDVATSIGIQGFTTTDDEVMASTEQSLINILISNQ